MSSEGAWQVASGERVSLASSDGTTTLRGYLWEAKAASKPAPRGIVVLVHGMCEHIERYEGFARTLARAGFAVCGYDQIGHGASADESRWGDIPSRGGADFLVEDVGRMRRLAEDRWGAGVPLFVFGHSMGSFVTLNYVQRHGEGLAGAVICGTGTVGVSKARMGNRVARLICATRGDNHKSPLLHSMADGAYSKAIPGARTEFDWLSFDRQNVDDYIADPACGFPFSAGGYATLTKLTERACDPACARSIPSDLPLLYIGGAVDPVGDFGKGVRAAADLARSSGVRDVTCTVYEGMRHEILQEAEAERVMADVVAWMSRRCGEERA